VNVTIPRKGTETIFDIDLIPIGINNYSKGGLCYNIKEREPINKMTSYYEYTQMVKEIKDEKTLQYLRIGNWDKISSRPFYRKQ